MASPAFAIGVSIFSSTILSLENGLKKSDIMSFILVINDPTVVTIPPMAVTIVVPKAFANDIPDLRLFIKSFINPITLDIAIPIAPNAISTPVIIFLIIGIFLRVLTKEVTPLTIEPNGSCISK